MPQKTKRSRLNIQLISMNLAPPIREPTEFELIELRDRLLDDDEKEENHNNGSVYSVRPKHALRTGAFWKQWITILCLSMTREGIDRPVF